ncbi:alpha/beta hydrolase [Rheinheimera sp.]|uniref:alpha/beta hydrolase n=1 Tax=Rheinheimera sp. TaxID=1869214 RepID=UPI00307DDFC1
MHHLFHQNQRTAGLSVRQWLKVSVWLVLLGLSSVTQAEQLQTLAKDKVWTQAGQTELKLDIYKAASTKDKAPVLIIYHGGGWLVNNKSIMDSTAHYLASHSGLLVVNADYRLLSADNNSTTMNQIVEDALGAVAWVKQHIAGYGGDPSRIAVTGDSAGGHLAAMVVLSADKLSQQGFSKGPGGYKPSYIPDGKTAEQLDLSVQAAVISYGALDLTAAGFANFETAENGFWKWGNAEPRGIFGPEINRSDNPEYYRALSPVSLIPDAKVRRLPAQFVHVGSKDQLTTPELASSYVEKLRAAGQKAELKIYQGYNHAYLDNGCNEFLGHCFERDAPVVLNDMIAFLQRELAVNAD